MAEDKIGIVDIQAALRMKFALSDKESMEVLSKFFQLIKKGLEEDKYVKVKGLGIFKLIEVEPRKSVSVNTREEVQIDAYRKVTFTPDAQLKELINKPFAHFENIELKEGVKPVEVVWHEEEKAVSPESVSEPTQAPEAPPASEVKDSATDELAIHKREDLKELEQLMAKEHNKSRFFLGVIVVLVVLSVIGGLLFFLAPEAIEQLIYGQ